MPVTSAGRILLSKVPRSSDPSTYDDAGVGILPLHVFQATNARERAVPYEKHTSHLKRRWKTASVPPLSALCLVKMIGVQLEGNGEWLATFDPLGAARHIHDSNITKPPSPPPGANKGAKLSPSPSCCDMLLDALEPQKSSSTLPGLSTRYHPDLWLKLAISYTPSSLPASYRVKSLPLSDPHVPLLQSIEPSERFTMITVLCIRDSSLSSALDDTSIKQLGALHQLVALDLAGTGIGVEGVRALTRTLRHSEEEDGVLKGPWKLRWLSLRGCPGIHDAVFEPLAQWPLLCVVGASCFFGLFKPPPATFLTWSSSIDCRDTVCSRFTIPSWPHSPFPIPASDLVHPTHPLRALQLLHSAYHSTEIFPTSEFPYALLIDKLDHPIIRVKDERERGRDAGGSGDGVLTLIPGDRRQRVAVMLPPHEEEGRFGDSSKEEAPPIRGRHRNYPSGPTRSYRRDGSEGEDDSDADSESETNPMVHRGIVTPLLFGRRKAREAKAEQTQRSSLEAFFTDLQRDQNPPSPSPASDDEKTKNQHTRGILVRPPPPYLTTLARVHQSEADSASVRTAAMSKQQVLSGEAAVVLRKKPPSEASSPSIPSAKGDHNHARAPLSERKQLPGTKRALPDDDGTPSQPKTKTPAPVRRTPFGVPARKGT